MIPFYQLPYFSRDEMAALAREGLFQGVLDKDDCLCAVRCAFVESNSIYGWVAVRHGYKDYNGFGLLFVEQAMKYNIEHQLKASDWISTTNDHSLQYHEKLGYQRTGRYCDRWLLNGIASN